MTPPCLPPVKRHALCLWCHGDALCAETFSQHWGSIYSFSYAMWSECLTDNLAQEDEELRLHGLVDAPRLPCGSRTLPLSLPSQRFHTPWQQIAAFSNSPAGLHPDFCGIRVFYVRLLLLCQSWLISLFLFWAFHLQLVCFHFAMVYHLVCPCISSICCSAFSLSQSLNHWKLFCAHWTTVTLSRQFIFTPLPLHWDSEDIADLFSVAAQACRGQRQG